MESLGGNFQIYENSGYRNERQKKQTLVIDLQDADFTEVPGPMNFSVTLQEPFIIDTLCDVYIDSLTTFNSAPNTGATTLLSSSNYSAFVVGIDDFAINTNTNTSSLFNQLVIPNETTTANTLKIHKGKKMNYVCQMNPQTLYRLSGTVANMATTPASMVDVGILTAGTNNFVVGTQYIIVTTGGTDAGRGSQPVGTVFIAGTTGTGGGTVRHLYRVIMEFVFVSRE
jgi:hypothetical protein